MVARTTFDVRRIERESGDREDWERRECNSCGGWAFGSEESLYIERVWEAFIVRRKGLQYASPMSRLSSLGLCL